MRVSSSYIILAVSFVTQSQCAPLIPGNIVTGNTVSHLGGGVHDTLTSVPNTVDEVTGPLSYAPIAVSQLEHPITSAPLVDDLLNGKLLQKRVNVEGDVQVLGSEILDITDPHFEKRDLMGLESASKVVADLTSGLPPTRLIDDAPRLASVPDINSLPFLNKLPIEGSLPGLSASQLTGSLPLLRRSLSEFGEGFPLLSSSTPFNNIPGLSGGFPMFGSPTGFASRFMDHAGAIPSLSSLPMMDGSLPRFKVKRDLGNLSQGLLSTAPIASTPNLFDLAGGLPIIDSQTSSLNGPTRSLSGLTGGWSLAESPIGNLAGQASSLAGMTSGLPMIDTQTDSL